MSTSRFPAWKVPMTVDISTIERLIKLLHASRRGVVFTGAGISTESGIPDFRSPGGIWSKYRLIDFQEFMASEQARREYWRRKFATHEAVAGAEPNQGHLAVTELVRRGMIAVADPRDAPSITELSELYNLTFLRRSGHVARRKSGRHGLP